MSDSTTGIADASHNWSANRDTIALVRWALTITCAYLVLFSERSHGTQGLGPIVIVAFLVSNLLIGRLPTRVVGAARFTIAIAALDSVLIGASLYASGQTSVELVLLFLGVIVVTIAGFHLGVIAALTVGMAATSLLIVWWAGGRPLLNTSLLLRVPLLLAAALVYAWLCETNHHDRAERRDNPELITDLERELSVQLEMIHRCQAALSQGLVSVAQLALDEVAMQNRSMRSKAAGPQHQADDADYVGAVVHSAA